MGTILGILIVVLVIGFIFYACLIYPIQSLIHCAKNPELSGNSRALWMLAIFFIWPIAAYFYAAKHKSKVSLLRTSLSVGGFVLIIVGTLFYVSTKLGSEVKSELAKIDVKGATRDLASQDAQFMEQSVATVQSELEGGSFLDFDSKAISLQLFDLVKTYTKDKNIDKEEFKNWKDLFGLREKLDEEKLKEFVEKEKLKELSKPNKEAEAATTKAEDRQLTPEEQREIAGHLEKLGTELEKLEKALPSKEELEKAQKALEALEAMGGE